jgi:chromosome segregation and condensation protein ScpB
MSVLEELHAVEQRLVARLQELQPLVDEYEELKRAAERLGVDLTRAADQRVRPAVPKRRPKRSVRSSTGRRRAGGTRATGAERRERVLALISDRPGITVSEMSREMGVDAPQLYRVVRKLQADGLIKKQGMNLTAA